MDNTKNQFILNKYKIKLQSLTLIMHQQNPQQLSHKILHTSQIGIQSKPLPVIQSHQQQNLINQQIFNNNSQSYKPNLIGVQDQNQNFEANPQTIPGKKNQQNTNIQSEQKLRNGFGLMPAFIIKQIYDTHIQKTNILKEKLRQRLNTDQNEIEPQYSLRESKQIQKSTLRENILDPNPTKNIQKIKQVQRKRSQLMEKLKKLDRKIQIIKKQQTNVMYKSSAKSYSRDTPIKQQLKQYENIDRHQNAMNLIKKLTEQKREREQRKIRQLQQKRMIQQMKIEKLMEIKNKQREERIAKLTLRQKMNEKKIKITQNVNHSLTIQSTLPLIQNKKILKEQKDQRFKNIQVQFNPTIKVFPKSKIHKMIIEEEKANKMKQQIERAKKIEQNVKRKQYTFGSKKIIGHSEMVAEMKPKFELKQLSQNRILNKIKINAIIEQQQKKQNINKSQQNVDSIHQTNNQPQKLQKQQQNKQIKNQQIQILNQ